MLIPAEFFKLIRIDAHGNACIPAISAVLPEDQVMTGIWPELVQQAPYPVKRRLQCAGRIAASGLLAPQHFHQFFLRPRPVPVIDHISQQQPNLMGTAFSIRYLIATGTQGKIPEHLYPQLNRLHPTRSLSKITVLMQSLPRFSGKCNVYPS